MRDYVVLVLVLLTIPLALYRPFFGVLGFSWLAYMRPQDLAWGLAAGLPLSKWVALALWASLTLRGKINIFRPSAVTIVMAALWMWLVVASVAAVEPEIAYGKLQDITKVLIIAFISVVVVADERRFRITIAVIGLSIGFLGLKYGLYGILRGGVHFTRGVGGMIGDNNDFALALNMALPLLVYLSRDLQGRWLRLASVGLVPMTALTVVFTHSRGGFLSLAAVTLYFIATSRRKVTALAVVVAMTLVGSLTVPASFYERIASIGDYQSDSSSMGRLNAWAASWRMANDHPFTGVGLDNFLLEFRYYAPDPEDMHVAHNTWLQILAETGYVGLTLYVLLHGATGFTLWRARRRARRHGKAWAATAAQCLGASMLAFLVGGTFLNRAHFDLVYHLMAMSVALDRVLAWQIAHPNVEEESPPAERAPVQAVPVSPEVARV